MTRITSYSVQLVPLLKALRGVICSLLLSVYPARLKLWKVWRFDANGQHLFITLGCLQVVYKPRRFKDGHQTFVQAQKDANRKEKKSEQEIPSSSTPYIIRVAAVSNVHVDPRRSAYVASTLGSPTTVILSEGTSLPESGAYQYHAETKNYTDKISLLEEEVTALKTAKASFLKDIDMLKEKLSESQVENGKSGKIIHDQCETISTLENETKILRKEIENLEEKIAELKETKDASEIRALELEKEITSYKKEIQENKNGATGFSNFISLYQRDLAKKNEKITSLEQSVSTANKNLESLQKELNSKETASKELEKEISSLKQAVFKMTEEVKKSESSKLELEKTASKLTDELKASQDMCQQHSSRLKELENKSGPSSRPNSANMPNQERRTQLFTEAMDESHNQTRAADGLLEQDHDLITQKKKASAEKESSFKRCSTECYRDRKRAPKEGKKASSARRRRNSIISSSSSESSDDDS